MQVKAVGLGGIEAASTCEASNRTSDFEGVRGYCRTRTRECFLGYLLKYVTKSNKKLE